MFQQTTTVYDGLKCCKDIRGLTLMIPSLFLLHHHKVYIYIFYFMKYVYNFQMNFVQTCTLNKIMLVNTLMRAFFYTYLLLFFYFWLMYIRICYFLFVKILLFAFCRRIRYSFCIILKINKSSKETKYDLVTVRSLNFN